MARHLRVEIGRDHGLAQEGRLRRRLHHVGARGLALVEEQLGPRLEGCRLGVGVAGGRREMPGQEAR